MDESPFSELVGPATVHLTAILDPDLCRRVGPADRGDEEPCMPALRGRQVIERPVARARAAVPDTVGLALPVLELQLGAVAVPVNQDHRVMAVVLDQHHARVLGVPATGGDERVRRQLADRIVHRCSAQSGALPHPVERWARRAAVKSVVRVSDCGRWGCCVLGRARSRSERPLRPGTGSTASVRDRQRGLGLGLQSPLGGPRRPGRTPRRDRPGRGRVADPQRRTRPRRQIAAATRNATR